MRKLLSWFVSLSMIAGVALLTAGAARRPQIAVEDVWARPLPPVVESGEVYMVIRNTGSEPDRLVSAQSPACGMIVMFQRYRTPQGAMSMRSTGPIEVHAGQRVELKVDGRHLMCMEKKQEFKAGTQLPLTLKFEKFGDVRVQVTIKAR
ncbi:MAG: copper chaperone PCu(A)C [Armatimonadota bacterium]